MKSVIVKALMCTVVMAQVSFAGIIFQDDFSTSPLSNGWSMKGVSPDVSEITTDGTKTVLHMKKTSTEGAVDSGYSRTFNVADDQQYLTVLCNFRSMSGDTKARDLALTGTITKDDESTGDLSYMLTPWNTDQVFVLTNSGYYGTFMGGVISTSQYYWAAVEIGQTSTRVMLLDDSGNIVAEADNTTVTMSDIAGKSVTLDMFMVPQLTGGVSEVAINDLKVLNEAFTTVDAPEPATMALLALGGLGLIRRKRA